MSIRAIRGCQKKEPSPTLAPRAPRMTANPAPDCATRVGRLRRPTLRYVTQPLRGNSPAPPSFELRHSSFPPAVFVDHESHELDECCGDLASSQVFVSIRAIRGCQKRTIPNPGAACAAQEHHAGTGLRNQGRPPAASNSSLCVATASRYQYCSAVSRASDFVIPSSLGISSFVLLRRVPG